MRKNSRKPEIPELDIILGIKEEVAWLDVSVENLALLPVVALSQGKNYLQKDFPDNIFSNIVFLRFAFLNELSHIAVLAVLHDNVNLLRILIYDPMARVREQC
jgi:hypothetical protein